MATIHTLSTPARELDHLRRHFVLIETTSTVLDESSGLVWSIRAMRLSFGADTVRTWLTERHVRRSCLPVHVRCSLVAPKHRRPSK